MGHEAGAQCYLHFYDKPCRWVQVGEMAHEFVVIKQFVHTNPHYLTKISIMGLDGLFTYLRKKL